MDSSSKSRRWTYPWTIKWRFLWVNIWPFTFVKMKIFDHFEISFGWVVIWKSISRFKKGVIKIVRWWKTLIGHFQENFFPRWTVQKFCCRRPNFEQNIFEIWSQNFMTKFLKFYREFAREKFCDRQTNTKFFGHRGRGPLVSGNSKIKKKSFLIIII